MSQHAHAPVQGGSPHRSRREQRRRRKLARHCNPGGGRSHKSPDAVSPVPCGAAVPCPACAAAAAARSVSRPWHRWRARCSTPAAAGDVCRKRRGPAAHTPVQGRISAVGSGSWGGRQTAATSAPRCSRRTCHTSRAVSGTGHATAACLRGSKTPHGWAGSRIPTHRRRLNGLLEVCSRTARCLHTGLRSRWALSSMRMLLFVTTTQ